MGRREAYNLKSISRSTRGGREIKSCSPANESNAMGAKLFLTRNFSITL